MTDKKSPSALVLPFGKHKGSTVAELLTKDPAYAEWVANQGWVAERFAELHAAILSRGAATDDSPEHNAIQVRFLDETFRVACLLAADPKSISTCRDRRWKDLSWEPREELSRINSRIRDLRIMADRNDKWKDEYDSRIAAVMLEMPEHEARIRDIHTSRPKLLTYVKFEQRGVDVELFVKFGADDYSRTSIEIKPTMGDDFPSVMRQIERLRVRVLVVGEYTGRAVSEPQLRQMFEANDLKLIFVRDIEAEIANARAELAT